MTTTTDPQPMLPALSAPSARRRARPPKRKTRITIYLDDEVLDAFRAHAARTGTGYQTLINAALRLRLEGGEALSWHAGGKTAPRASPCSSSAKGSKLSGCIARHDAGPPPYADYRSPFFRFPAA